MADEVYQDNVYSKDKSFVSFKKVCLPFTIITSQSTTAKPLHYGHNVSRACCCLLLIILHRQMGSCGPSGVAEKEWTVTTAQSSLTLTDVAGPQGSG